MNEEKAVEIHFRVTLSQDLRPHKIVSIWASDRKKAKTLAVDLHPDWEVVQARISNNQNRSEGA